MLRKRYANIHTCLQDSLERGVLIPPTTVWGILAYSIDYYNYLGILHKSNKTLYVNFCTIFNLKMAIFFGCLHCLLLFLMRKKIQCFYRWTIQLSFRIYQCVHPIHPKVLSIPMLLHFSQIALRVCTLVLFIILSK